MTTLATLCLVAAEVASSAWADMPLDSTAVHLGITSVRSLSPGDDPDSEVRAWMTVERPSKTALSRGGYWGADDGKARFVVTGLVVTVGGDTALIPFGAYGDLAEPKSMAIERTVGAFTVVIRGGEAAQIYSAKLQIESPLVLRKRRVESFGLPHPAWEETVYSQYRFYPKDFKP
jgi:hypothetical protein